MNKKRKNIFNINSKNVKFIDYLKIKFKKIFIIIIKKVLTNPDFYASVHPFGVHSSLLTAHVRVEVIIP